jgi:hypothetical protein
MKLLSVFVLALSLIFVSARADAQARRSAPRTGGQSSGQAVPRTGPSSGVPGPGVAPRGVLPSRSFYSYYYPRGYYYPYGFSLGFYAGYPYGYPYGYYGYPYAYGSYGYGYGYGYPAGYAAGGPASAYGAVRIQGAPRDAQVYADGYYVGIADDFDGTFQHLNLTPGAHRIEIRAPGAPPASFDVRVEPGQTITYHAN